VPASADREYPVAQTTLFPMTGAGNRSQRSTEERQLTAILETLAKVAADDPIAVEKAVRGSLALLGAFDAINIADSPLRKALDRLATLADAAMLPDGITGDIAFYRAAMGMKDQGVRDLMRRKAVPSDSTGRDPQDKRSRRMYRTDEVFQTIHKRDEPRDDDRSS